MLTNYEENGIIVALVTQEVLAMHPLVFQTDFGLVDGAVSAMYGVAYCVHPELRIHDLTHDITPFNIWEASYRLIQTINYWPQNTVFVSVVDPGVGSERKSVVAKTKSGHLKNYYLVLGFAM